MSTDPGSVALAVFKASVTIDVFANDRLTMFELSTIQQIAVWLLPVLFAITLHEAAHGWVAHKLGDSTAKMLGRLTINPLKHIDLIGTIIVPVAILLLSQFQFVFGWAKPVPINVNNMKNPRRDIALATAAGPLANLLMALFWGGMFKLALYLQPQTYASALFLLLMARAGIIINILLAFFNLLPIPPLDGGRVAVSLLPYKAASALEKVEPYGFFIILLLLLTNLLSWILMPFINGSMQIIRFIFQI